MIEQALHDRLQPIVDRRKRLYSASRLSLCWIVLGLVGTVLILLHSRFDVSLSNAFIVLCLLAIVAAITVIRRASRFQPDYRSVARNIEQHHPELKALLLTAVEQKPEGLDGQFGYLQMQVLREALIHATDHDWLEAVPIRRLKWAGIARTTALLFLIVVLWQMLPGPLSIGGARPARREQVTQVIVMPGDTKIEAGTSVLVTARFEGTIPNEVTVAYGSTDQEPQQMILTRPLADPVFGGLIPQIKADTVYRIAYGGQRMREYMIHVFEYPTLTKADAKIVYPSYTKLPEKRIENTRQISVVEGSQVTLSFTLNKPVATARLVPREGEPVDLIADANHANVYTTLQTVTQSRRYELRLVDADGLAGKIPPRFTVDVHKNLPAQIKPVFPNRDIEASPIEELTLQAEASDDFGVTHYGLTWSLVGVRDQEVTLGTAQGVAGKQSLSYLLALEPLNAKPDQLLTYYFWAEDVGPDGQTRRTASDIYFAEVRPFEQVFRESQSFQNEQDRQQQDPQNQEGEPSGRQRAEQLVRLQKQIITATWNIKQKADSSGKVTEQKDDLEVVHQSQQDALNQAQQALTQAEDPASSKALQAAGGHMQTSLDRLVESTQSASSGPLAPALGAEQAAYQELLKLRQREFQVAQSQRGNRSNNNSAQFDQQLRQLEMTQQENRYESERLARSQQQQAQREDLQVLNRLRDLARRQNDMSERLREAESSLRQARNDQEREQVRRELQRLRDEQLQSMQDVDELQARMDQPENRQRMSDADRQLDESRSQIRESTEQLEQGMVSNAITSTTRAQRQLEQMRDELQRNTSSQFVDEMRNMREQAQELDRRQRQISEQLRRQNESGFKSLTDNGATQELANQLNRQRSSAQELTDQMKKTSEQSETSEPLLSRALYDTLRQASAENLDRALQVTEELVRRNFVPQAQETEPQATQGIETLRKGVEEAAASVLGSEADSLRLAQQQLDDLIRQVNDEATRAGQRGAGDPNRMTGDPNRAVAGLDPNQSRMADAQSPQGRRGGQRGQQGQSADSQQQAEQGQGSVAMDQEQTQGQGGRGQRAGRDGRGGQGDRSQDQVARGNRGMRGNRGGQGDPNGGGNDTVAGGRRETSGTGPLTGNDYRQWSDRLRDVEEMLPQQELRNQVAEVRDQARTMRADFLRRGKEPQWNLVQQDIMRPLAELRQRIGERLAQLQSEDKLVPIDRDPVPGRFAEAVRRYFENLGGDAK
jgi:hypothetical protein